MLSMTQLAGAAAFSAWVIMLIPTLLTAETFMDVWGLLRPAAWLLLVVAYLHTSGYLSTPVSTPAKDAATGAPVAAADTGGTCCGSLDSEGGCCQDTAEPEASSSAAADVSPPSGCCSNDGSQPTGCCQDKAPSLAPAPDAESGGCCGGGDGEADEGCCSSKTVRGGVAVVPKQLRVASVPGTKAAAKVSAAVATSTRPSEGVKLRVFYASVTGTSKVGFALPSVLQPGCGERSLFSFRAPCNLLQILRNGHPHPAPHTPAPAELCREAGQGIERSERSGRARAAGRLRP